MSKFKVGDKIRLYGWVSTRKICDRCICKVEDIIGYEKGWIRVSCEKDQFTVHEKQCRKLVKKKLKLEKFSGYRNDDWRTLVETFLPGMFIQITSDNWQVWTGKKFRRMTEEEQMEASR